MPLRLCRPGRSCETRPEVEARLVYPRGGGQAMVLDDTEEKLKELAAFLQAAATPFCQWKDVIGSWPRKSGWYDLSFALPRGSKGRLSEYQTIVGRPGAGHRCRFCGRRPEMPCEKQLRAAPADVDARIQALTHHHRTLLVEAGAGSGKTALMAGQGGAARGRRRHARRTHRRHHLYRGGRRRTPGANRTHRQGTWVSGKEPPRTRTGPAGGTERVATRQPE